MPAAHVDKVHEAVSQVVSMVSDSQSGATDMVLLVACGCMAASTVAFWSKAKESTKRFNYVAMAVTGIATMAYLAMFSGAGIMEVDGRDVYWMRYVDWFFTTPFFLLDLALLANADMWDTFFVMLLNAICIVCGAIGALQPSARVSMFVLGMVTFIGFNAKLFGSMMANASSLGDDVSGKYKAVTTLTMGIWCAYPVMYWLCEVTGALSTGTEVFLYAILDVVAKCVCSFILLGSDDILAQVNAKAPGYQSMP
jgi:bacteriorhodopsin